MTMAKKASWSSALLLALLFCGHAKAEDSCAAGAGGKCSATAAKEDLATGQEDDHVVAMIQMRNKARGVSQALKASTVAAKPASVAVEKSKLPQGHEHLAHRPLRQGAKPGPEKETQRVQAVEGALAAATKHEAVAEKLSLLLVKNGSSTVVSAATPTGTTPATETSTQDLPRKNHNAVVVSSDSKTGPHLTTNEVLTIEKILAILKDMEAHESNTPTGTAHEKAADVLETVLKKAKAGEDVTGYIASEHHDAVVAAMNLVFAKEGEKASVDNQTYLTIDTMRKLCGELDTPENSNDPNAVEGDMVATNSKALALLQEAAGKSERFVENLWVGSGSIPFCFEPGVSAEMRTLIADAMNEINTLVPCVGFTEVNWQQGTVGDEDSAKACQGHAEAFFFQTPGNGKCYANVGFLAGRVTIVNLDPDGCDLLGIAIHEVLHGLGVMHEHSRPDRDSKVRILTQNIKAGNEHNFDIAQKGDTGVGYDVLSIMHYGATTFGKLDDTTNEPMTTIEVLDGSSSEIGNRVGMTSSDVDQLARMYGCAGSVKTPCTSDATSETCEACVCPSGSVKIQTSGQGSCHRCARQCTTEAGKCKRDAGCGCPEGLVRQISGTPDANGVYCAACRTPEEMHCGIYPAMTSDQGFSSCCTCPASMMKKPSNTASGTPGQTCTDNQCSELDTTSCDTDATCDCSTAGGLKTTLSLKSGGTCYGCRSPPATCGTAPYDPATISSTNGCSTTSRCTCPSDSDRIAVFPMLNSGSACLVCAPKAATITFDKKLCPCKQTWSAYGMSSTDYWHPYGSSHFCMLEAGCPAASQPYGWKPSVYR